MTEEITQQTATITKHLWSFVEAEAMYHFTNIQQNTFSTLEQAIIHFNEDVDDEHLAIDIGKTSDDEIFISRKSLEGINTLLIYEDGTMAHSFIPHKESNKPDFLHFFEPVEAINYKQVLLQFFSY